MLEKIGQYQTCRFHVFQLTVFGLIFLLSSLTLLSLPTFLREVHCGDISKCQETITCSYNLTCDDFKREHAQTAALLGSFLMNLVFSLLGGYLGRKTCMLISFLLYVAGLVLVINPRSNYYLLVTGLFLVGGIMAASSTFVFVLINEVFAESWR